MIDILLLLGGFVALVYGADKLVDASASFAKKLNIPSIVIGLTIVSFGTSAPEFVVNLFASLENNSDIVLGNILGSNISNMLLILGASAVIYPLTVKKQTTWIEIPLSAMAAIAVFLLASDQLIDKATVSVLTRIDGLILLLFFLVFIAYNISLTIKSKNEEDIETKDYSILISTLLIIGGLTLLAAGGKAIVYAATNLAETFGISQRIIGIIIVGIGTSLPELATSIVAARNKKTDIAIGNIVGSNIFNTFFVLGTSATISSVQVSSAAMYDIYVNILCSMLLFGLLFIGKSHTLSRKEGIVMLGLFVAYILSITL
jgi:cation:H+ antiporter